MSDVSNSARAPPHVVAGCTFIQSTRLTRLTRDNSIDNNMDLPNCQLTSLY